VVARLRAFEPTMRIKLLTFRYSATLGGFDDNALVDFARDKEVIAFREHFYVVNEVPHLSCIVHYQDAIVPRAALEAAREIPARPPSNPQHFQRRDGRPDPCAGLNDSERALFNHLREWRSKQSRDDGVPPYLVLTDKQVVALVRRRPESPTALGHIDGLGPGKIERCGSAILERLHGQSAPAPRPDPSAANAPEMAPQSDAVAELEPVAVTAEVAPWSTESDSPPPLCPTHSTPRTPAPPARRRSRVRARTSASSGGWRGRASQPRPASPAADRRPRPNPRRAG